MDKKYDIVIVGSGISGMSLAYYCARDQMNVLVLEKSNSLGGSFTTKNSDNYWIEMGAHTMYNSYGNLIDVIEGCGLADDIIKRKKVPYKTFKDGKISSVISQFSIPEMLFSLPSLFKIKKDHQTVESYYSRIVGKRNYHKFFQYMFNAVPSQPTNDFPADVLFKKRNRRKDILKSFTLRQGIKSIIEAISKMPGIDVITGENVPSITMKGDSYQIISEDQDIYEAEYLALAAPVNATAELTRSLLPEISQEISKIDYVYTDSVGITIEKKDVNIKEVAGIIGINEDFYSVVSRDVVEDEKYRGFVFHFKPGKLDNPAKTEFICRVLGISKENIKNTFYIKNTVPSFKLGHESIVKEIEKLLEGNKLLLTGNYFSGMAIEDCVSRSRNEFNRLQKLRN
jgi:protoporphyrinogen oxidase